MISYLAGKLADKKLTEVVVDVHGVGYHVWIPSSTFERLPAEGEAVKLFTHFVVREDAQQLYGFASTAERSVFETMLAVSGVGPKLALAALSAMRPEELRDRVLEGDTAMLTNIPGVGRKTAERLVVELKDRFAKLPLGGGRAAGASAGGSEAVAEARADALAALETLGLGRAAAERALRKALRNHPGTHSADALVRLALREKG